MTLEVEAALRGVLEADPVVEGIEPVGSRSRGEAGPLSDWDLRVSIRDFPSLRGRLPRLVAPLEPLAAQWDRLSDEECYMLIVRGPMKIDLIFDEPHTHEPPWTVSAETLPGIDAHFWDWIWWLASKVRKGLDDYLTGELAKLHAHLLGPLGADGPPRSLEEAVQVYVPQREGAEMRLGCRVTRDLGDEVLAGLRRADFVV